jgi:hypothetical protein
MDCDPVNRDRSFHLIDAFFRTNSLIGFSRKNRHLDDDRCNHLDAVRRRHLGLRGRARHS